MHGGRIAPFFAERRGHYPKKRSVCRGDHFTKERTDMKKRCIAGVIAVLMLLPIFPVFAHAEGGEFTLAPCVAEGVSVTESSPGSMSVRGHAEGGLLVFDETKTVSFEAHFAEGWAACTRYSHFFPGDSRAAAVLHGDGVCDFRFNAAVGESVSLAEWNAVAVNASCTELPKLYIDAAADFADIDRETWVEASFTLTLGSKHFESGDYEGEGFVKGRGNSSWGYPKKPYSIKLGSKASLLDIPKTKKYAVIPSYNDGSLIRNYITYKSWQQLLGISYVPKCELIEVYLNGEYNGIYLLVERIDIEKSKINIEQADADNMTGGYLIEKDVGIKMDFEEDLWFDCPYWANQSKDYFVLKSPEPEDSELAEAMLAYLTDYMQRVHDSIMGGGEDYPNYVDTSSWVDFIIVQEVAKNIDGSMKTSCYMYKDRDDEHLYMTAPWDFDLAYGRVTWNNQDAEHNDVIDCPNADTYDGFMVLNSSNPWMDRLYDTVPEFRAALMLRYAEYRDTVIEGMFAMIDEQAAYLAVVQQPNYELWGMPYHIAVNNLKKWLHGRLEWLDSQWLGGGLLPGDVDMDGSITALDALSVLRASLGIEELGAGAAAAADVDDDGSVTASDALIILRRALGLA